MKESDPFEKDLAAGEAAASGAGGASQTSENSGRMYVRTQGFGSTDAELRFLQRCGVRHKAATFPFHPDRGWILDELIRDFPTSSTLAKARSATGKLTWYAK